MQENNCRIFETLTREVSLYFFVYVLYIVLITVHHENGLIMENMFSLGIMK